MKNIVRAIALFAVAVLLIGALASCSGADYAIKVGNSIISENDYKRSVATLRQNYLQESGEEDTKELWTTEDEQGSTLSEMLTDALQQDLIEKKLYAEQFEKLGLSFSAEEEQALTESVAQIAESYGSMTAFNNALADGYYTYDEFMTEYYDAAKKTKVLSHYFGEKGEKPVSLQDLKNYYALNHIYVKFIYITKQDEDGNFFVGKELQAARDRAQETLEAARRESEKDYFPDLIETHSDMKADEADGMVITNDGTFNEKVEKAAFGLELGEVTLVETESALMILKRYDGTTDELFTATLRQQTLEEIRAEEIEVKLTEWEQEFKVKINQKMLKKYRPEKFIKE